MLLVEAIGRVTADLEAQEGRKGPYFHFSLAVKRGFAEQEHTAFLDCWSFGETASRLADAEIKKGRAVWISGDGDLSSFTRRDGSKDHALKVVVSQWGFLPFSKPSQSTTDPQEIPPPMEPPPEIDGDEEELP